MTFDNILIKTLLLSGFSFAYFNFISSSPQAPVMDPSIEYFTLQLPKDKPLQNFVVKIAATQLANSAPYIMDQVLKLTATWAEKQYPLAAAILQGVNLLPKSEVANIPGSGPFLEIINETVSHHNKTIEELENKTPDKKTYRDYLNFTIEEVMDDLKDNHNISLSQIPFSKSIDVTKLANIPGLQDLVKEAMFTNINGTPFAITLLELVNHIKGEVRLQDFSSPTVIVDIKKNVSSVFGPLIKIQTKKAIEKLANNSGYGDQYKYFKRVLDMVMR